MFPNTFNSDQDQPDSDQPRRVRSGGGGGLSPGEEILGGCIAAFLFVCLVVGMFVGLIYGAIQLEKVRVRNLEEQQWNNRAKPTPPNEIYRDPVYEREQALKREWKEDSRRRDERYKEMRKIR